MCMNGKIFVAIVPSGYSAVIYCPVITVLCAQQVFYQLETVIKYLAMKPKLKKKKEEKKTNS